MRSIFVILSILLVMCWSTPSAHSQGGKQFSQKLIPVQGSIKLREQAELYYSIGDYAGARPLYEQLTQRYPSRVEFIYKTGVCFLYEPGEAGQAISYLERVLHLDPDREGLAFHLGIGYHANNDFDLGIKYFDFLLASKSLASSDRELISRMRNSCEVGKELVANELNILIRNMGEQINSEGTEYVPLLSADESTLIFTYKKIKASEGLKPGEERFLDDDIYISFKKDGNWSKPKSISDNINTDGEDEAAVSISADGKQILILKYSDETSGDIYLSTLKSGEWSKPTKLKGDINTAEWEGTASLSKDGKVIYFDSEREGGFGGTDIYRAELQKDGTWGNIVNLGKTINTPYNDESAFIHSDSKTLYFSSDGHKTMGGFDIFKSKMDRKGNWSTPENIGYPINTVANDKYYVVSTDGKRGYYHQNNPKGYGGLDLYMINYDLPARKEAAIEVEAKAEGKPLKVKVEGGKTASTGVDKTPGYDPNYVDNTPISISGTLKSEGSSPGSISKAKIKLLGDDKKIIAEAISDKEGKFAFRNIRGNKHYEIEVVIDDQRVSNAKSPETTETKMRISEDRRSTKQPNAPGAAATPGELQIANFTLCEDVQDRAPIRASTSFPAELDKIWFHTEVNLGFDVEATITHKWYYNGREVSSVDLRVKGPRWRTFSYKTVDEQMKGSWRVEVLYGGTVLAEKEFKVN